jgi:predicted RecA/RadA family phage recombinase
MAAVIMAVKSLSDHIRISAFPAAKVKGELTALGPLIGIADTDVLQGESGSIDCGKSVAVFRAKTADFSGSAAVGTQVFANADVLSTSGTLFGVIVAVNGDTIDIARV